MGAPEGQTPGCGSWFHTFWLCDLRQITPPLCASPHLQREDGNNICLRGRSWGISELVFRKHFQQAPRYQSSATRSLSASPSPEPPSELL